MTVNGLLKFQRSRQDRGEDFVDCRTRRRPQVVGGDGHDDHQDHGRELWQDQVCISGESFLIERTSVGARINTIKLF